MSRITISLLALLLSAAPALGQEANQNIRFGMPAPAATLFSFLARNSYLLDGGLVAGLASPFHSDVCLDAALGERLLQ
jgi:hypothetical protein